MSSIAWDDFERIDDVMEAGATVARNALPQIRKLLSILGEFTQESGKQGEYLISESLR